MEIKIAGNTFTFSDKSEVKVEGYDLYIVEPGFDKSTEKIEDGFTSMPISLPSFIRVNKCAGMDPCSKIYKDATGKRRLSAYYD
jgi:hypothetical protein